MPSFGVAWDQTGKDRVRWSIENKGAMTRLYISNLDTVREDRELFIGKTFQTKLII